MLVEYFNDKASIPMLQGYDFNSGFDGTFACGSGNLWAPLGVDDVQGVDRSLFVIVVEETQSKGN